MELLLARERKGKKFEASAIMFFEKEKGKKCRQVSRVFIIYMSFSLAPPTKSCSLENCSDGISEGKRIFVLYGEKKHKRNVSEF